MMTAAPNSEIIKDLRSTSVHSISLTCNRGNLTCKQDPCGARILSLKAAMLHTLSSAARFIIYKGQT